jgi:environmental stress-induced protein Ves
MTDRTKSWIRLGPADYRRTPWKNGGGVTIDIAGAFAPGAEPGGWSGMIWRLGRTRIEHPPFLRPFGF